MGEGLEGAIKLAEDRVTNVQEMFTDMIRFRNIGQRHAELSMQRAVENELSELRRNLVDMRVEL